jgi:peroxiredoxin
MTLAADLRRVALSLRATLTPENVRLLDHKLDWLRTSGLVQAALRQGELAPDFTLTGAHGETFALANLLDRGPAVLLFHCGGWCPICRTALIAYGRIGEAIDNAGGGLLAISPVRPEPVSAAADNGGWPGAMLWDQDGKVCKLFGLLYELPAQLVRLHRNLGIDLPALSGGSRWILPLPATYVVDGEAIAVFAHVDVDHTRRAEPEAVMEAIRAVAGAS